MCACYLQQWSRGEQVEVHVEAQHTQSDGGDVVKPHLEQLGGQQQKTQLRRRKSLPPHTESLQSDEASINGSKVELMLHVKFTLPLSGTQETMKHTEEKLPEMYQGIREDLRSLVTFRSVL